MSVSPCGVGTGIGQNFAGKVASNHRSSSVRGERGLRDRARPPSGVFTNRLRRDAGVQAKDASAPPRLTYPPSWTKVHIPLHLPSGCVRSFLFARSSWVRTTHEKATGRCAADDETHRVFLYTNVCSLGILLDWITLTTRRSNESRNFCLRKYF